MTEINKSVYDELIPGRVLFFLAGGAAAGAPCWLDATGAAPGSATAASCWCWDISGFIWSCWSPSLIPKKAAAAAADEFDAIALQTNSEHKNKTLVALWIVPWVGSVPSFLLLKQEQYISHVRRRN